MCAGCINDRGVSFVMLVLEAYLGLTAQTLCLQNGGMLSKLPAYKGKFSQD